MGSSFLGELTPEDFLKNYWNKKPLLIKNAVKNPHELASFDDFMAMAKDEYFETRMVYENGGEYPWQAKVGPFVDQDFNPEALWTLICHNLELLNSDFFELKQNIRFIPDWNFDDLMATISNKGASVGAHVDDYSVFIIQGIGKRKWLLEENPNPEYIPNLDIRLLQEFKPNIEWVLEEGDMLYIPPNIAHHGISLEDSISYSLGFKSIRYKDLLDHHITQVLVNVDEASFHDQEISIQEDPFLLSDKVADKIFADMLKFMDDKAIFKNSLLMYLSRPKNRIESMCNDSVESIINELKVHTPFKRDIWAKLVAIEMEAQQVKISINSNLYDVSNATYDKLKKMFLEEPETPAKLSKSELANNELVQIIGGLIGEGVFYFF